MGFWPDKAFERRGGSNSEALKCNRHAKSIIAELVIYEAVIDDGWYMGFDKKAIGSLAVWFALGHVVERGREVGGARLHVELFP